MPAMQFRTGDYIRCRGLEKPWPDPNVLKIAGVGLDRFNIPNSDRIAFYLYDYEKSVDVRVWVRHWGIEIRSGSKINLHLVPDVEGAWHDAVVLQRRTWLHWIEVSDTIVLTFEEV